MKRTRSLLLAGAACAAFLGVDAPAHAESIIKNPGDHPDYRLELEPHLNLGWGHLWAGTGLGVGGRFSIVIVDNGFVKTINNSVAISFGLDWLRYGDCYGYYSRYARCAGASYFILPVALQWNFWLTPQWSVFGEPGFYVYHGVWDDYCDYPEFSGDRFCRGFRPSRTSVDFAFWAGGRFHFNDKVALTMRIGYPTISFGVSIFF
jgi:hypothetical protein